MPDEPRHEPGGYLRPPIEPMLARAVEGATAADFPGAAFEPKWDGFRCLAFAGQDGLVLQGRGRARNPTQGRHANDVVDLGYAFPELVSAMGAQLRPGTILDGEIVMISEQRLDFAALSQRLRPRSPSFTQSIAELAARSPATYLAFDLLARPIAVTDSRGEALLDESYAHRRVELERLAAEWERPLMLTPSTEDPSLAMAWFEHFEAAGVDGLIVKPLYSTYQPGKRAQVKIKHRRSADVVVAGWRPQRAKDGTEVVGSLLLGLNDAQGRLHYVGGSSAFTADARRGIVADLARDALGPDDRHPWMQPDGNRVPGQPSRWGPGRDWYPVQPVRVAEVAFDQVQDGRFRHTAAFIRWRPDRSPASCGFDQFPVMLGPPIEALLDSAGLVGAPRASSGTPAGTASRAGPQQHRAPRD